MLFIMQFITFCFMFVIQMYGLRIKTEIMEL